MPSELRPPTSGPEAAPWLLSGCFLPFLLLLLFLAPSGVCRVLGTSDPWPSAPSPSLLPLPHPSCPATARSLDLGASLGRRAHSRLPVWGEVRSPWVRQGPPGSAGCGFRVDGGGGSSRHGPVAPDVHRPGRVLLASLLPPGPGNAHTLSQGDRRAWATSPTAVSTY